MFTKLNQPLAANLGVSGLPAALDVDREPARRPAAAVAKVPWLGLRVLTPAFCLTRITSRMIRRPFRSRAREAPIRVNPVVVGRSLEVELLVDDGDLVAQALRALLGRLAALLLALLALRVVDLRHQQVQEVVLDGVSRSGGQARRGRVGGVCVQSGDLLQADQVGLRASGSRPRSRSCARAEVRAVDLVAGPAPAPSQSSSMLPARGPARGRSRGRRCGSYGDASGPSSCPSCLWRHPRRRGSSSRRGRRRAARAGRGCRGSAGGTRAGDSRRSSFRSRRAEDRAANLLRGRNVKRPSPEVALRPSGPRPLGPRIPRPPRPAGP